MNKAIIGQKVGMSQLFDDSGNVVPVTIVTAGPCVVVQKKTEENDGYQSVQLGFGDVSPKHVNKPKQGHFSKGDVAFKRFLKEFRIEDKEAYNVGDIVKADVFETGDKVDVSGVSKGKGYAGTVKRYGTRTLKRTHGTGPVGRHAGSMGANSSPSRVMKGKKLPGHMGVDNVTIQNLDIVKIDAENNLIAIRGAIPGPKGGIVYITDAIKAVKA